VAGSAPAACKKIRHLVKSIAAVMAPAKKEHHPVSPIAGEEIKNGLTKK
jgi:hypothetical protein